MCKREDLLGGLESTISGDGKTGAKQAEIQSRTGGGRQYLIASDGIDNPPLRRFGGNVTVGGTVSQ